MSILDERSVAIQQADAAGVGQGHCRVQMQRHYKGRRRLIVIIVVVASFLLIGFWASLLTAMKAGDVAVEEGSWLFLGSVALVVFVSGLLIFFILTKPKAHWRR